jgi:threonine/homoserine/homoserine lactone efflux protein
MFIPTFFMVSFTPGMCMTLSLTLGMSIGLRRTFWMMWGELLGVALVSVAAVAGVATIMLNYPSVFNLLKYVGGGYLVYLGIRLLQSKGKMAIGQDIKSPKSISRRELAVQGFVTAIANPKGWAFMISLLPPFIDQSYPIIPQISILLIVLLSIEFLCMVIYASGGKRLRTFLGKKGGTALLNKTAGVLMMGVGVWLATG